MNSTKDLNGNYAFQVLKFLFRSLVDTVYALKDQLATMSQNYQDLRNEFEMEKKQMQSLKKLIDQWIPLIRDLKASTNL